MNIPKGSALSDDEDALQWANKNAKCVILPDNRFIQVWNLLMSALLLMIAIYVPIKVAFIDESTTVGISLDFFVDGLFLTDIVLTFFTAIEKRGGNIEVRHKYIARNYLKLWFWIDVVSTMPVQTFELEYFKDL
jgi:hypothetical protein